MEKSYYLSRLGVAGIAAFSIFAPQAANAVGVTAGTLIENTASASYDTGAGTENIASNTVQIKVDEVLDVAVTSLDSSPVSLPAAGAVLSFQVQNTGNGPESYTITVDAAVAGDDFDPSVTQIAYDSNNNGVYDAGVDTVIANGTATPEIAPDGSLRIFVVGTQSGSPADGDTGNVTLNAVAATGSGSTGTVFTGQGDGGGDAVVGTSTANQGATGAFVAQLSSVALVKSAVIADPYGGSQPVPGATVTYTLVASVSGSGTAQHLVISDNIPSGTSYIASSLKLDSAALTDNSGDDAGTADGTSISVDLGNVAGGASHTITFNVSID